MVDVHGLVQGWSVLAHVLGDTSLSDMAFSWMLWSVSLGMGPSRLSAVTVTQSILLKVYASAAGVATCQTCVCSYPVQARYDQMQSTKNHSFLAPDQCHPGPPKQAQLLLHTSPDWRSASSRWCWHPGMLWSMSLMAGTPSASWMALMLLAAKRRRSLESASGLQPPPAPAVKESARWMLLIAICSIFFVTGWRVE